MNNHRKQDFLVFVFVAAMMMIPNLLWGQVIKWPPKTPVDNLFQTKPKTTNARTPAGTLRETRADVTLNIKGFANDATAKKVQRAFWMAMDRWHRKHVLDATTKAFSKSADPALKNVTTTYNDAAEKDTVIAMCVLHCHRLGLDPNHYALEIEVVAKSNIGAAGRAFCPLQSAKDFEDLKLKRPKYAIELDNEEIKGMNDDQTAGVIWHEMLHNVGLTHPVGDYNAFLISEWGWAVQQNGATLAGSGGWNLVDGKWVAGGNAKEQFFRRYRP